MFPFNTGRWEGKRKYELNKTKDDLHDGLLLLNGDTSTRQSQRLPKTSVQGNPNVSPKGASQGRQHSERGK